MKVQTLLRKKLNILLTVLLSSLILFVATQLGLVEKDVLVPPTPETNESSPSATPTVKAGRIRTTVVSVVDGDTIKVEGGEIVRYIGMNTPETVAPGRFIECYGKEASAKNKELVQGKIVELEKDISERDRYGRLLRYVWLGDTMINETLVREGYAQVSTFPPDVKYEQVFLAAQREAMNEEKGLWSSICPKASPTPKPLPAIATPSATPVSPTD